MRNRLPIPLLSLALLFGCGDTFIVAPDAGLVVCAADSDCDDGLYCNGAETCSPAAVSAAANGCVAGTSPCPDGACDERARQCVSTCGDDADQDGDGHVSIACGGDDCDDADGDRFPGNTEVCDTDGHDEDCDGATFGIRDVDGDGVTADVCCNGEFCGLDCDDNARGTHPGVPEVCDGRDNDCDGDVDEQLLVPRFVDADHDGVGETGTERMVCPGAPGTADVGGDCDDDLALVRPTALEICDAIDNDCDGRTDENAVPIPWFVDRDGDGWGVSGPDDPPTLSCDPVVGAAPRAGDCDDSDAMINPTAAERCNGLDDDCDGLANYVVGDPADGDFEDDDRDGAPDARCEAPVSDCDDTDPFRIGAGTPEICDQRDNDCDGSVDEGATPVPWYADRDGDGHGDPGDSVSSCAPVPGRVRLDDDCDDGDGRSHPGAVDACEGQASVDDDCDGIVDEGGAPIMYFRDEDEDGYGAGELVVSCQLDAFAVPRGGDCDDTSAAVNPDALDDCAGLAGVDDDCDTRVDEDPDPRLYWTDADDDGYGGGNALASCEPPTDAVFIGGDCADGDPDRRPGVPDDCSGTDGVDEDCDGVFDEDRVPLIFYRDRDVDLHGDPGDTIEACVAPTGYVSDARDCDDTRGGTHADADEVCDDGRDNDCDMATDCADPDCAAACPVFVVLDGANQTATLHEPYAEPLRIRLESREGAPIPGRAVTIVTRGVSATEYTVVTDGSGIAAFTLRAGPRVGAQPVTITAVGALELTVDTLMATAPADGTIFSLMNGIAGSGFPTGGPAWDHVPNVHVSNIATGPDGSLYIASDQLYFRMWPDGHVERIGGGGVGAPYEGALATDVSLPSLSADMVVDPIRGELLFERLHTVWAMDLDTHRLRRIAGDGTRANTGDGGLAVDAQIRELSDMALSDDNGLLYLATPAGLRVVDAGGAIATVLVAGDRMGDLRVHQAVVSLAPVPDSDDIYASLNCITGTVVRGCIIRVSPDGTFAPVVGFGDDSTGEDVDASTVRIDAGGGGTLATLDNGDLAYAERTWDRIRVVTPGGTVRTVAGTLNTEGNTGDGGPAIDALIGGGAIESWGGHIVLFQLSPRRVRVIW